MKFLKDAYITALKVRFEVGMRTMGGRSAVEVADWAAYFIAGGSAPLLGVIYLFVIYKMGSIPKAFALAFCTLSLCAYAAIYSGNKSLLKSIGYNQIRSEFSEKKTVSMFADAPLVSWTFLATTAILFWLLWKLART